MEQANTGTNPDGANGQHERKAGTPWQQRFPRLHTIVRAAPAAVVAAGVGFVIWWIVAESFTPDGDELWGTKWTCMLALVVVAAAVSGGWTASVFRRRRSNRPDEDDTSLFWLVGGGILTSIVLAAGMGYAQAELLTAPGESVASLDGSELLDIARSTAFALGAVAVLLVNYRKQRSVEAALRHDQSKHRDDLEHEPP